MKKMISMMVVLAAACAAFGETYEQGKVYSPIRILGDETVTVDGHGAIIDGGGVSRCATLGPNVTVKNFTFRNGSAAVGGGVWGGKVVDCAIRDCGASEYGAAVAACSVSATTITGCKRLLDGSVKASMHGGIAADSTLEGVTISGCRVELGTAVPGFGGIAANSALSGCTVTGNTMVVSGDHYGLLFYGGSISDSTITGNSVDSSLDDIAAYMKVTPTGCRLDGDNPPPPGPTPPGPPPPGPVPPEPTPEDGQLYADSQIGEFESGVGATYDGWLRHNGVIVGVIQVKTTASRSGAPVKTSVKVTPVGSKKKSYKTQVYRDGESFTDGFGIQYGSNGLKGTVSGIDGIPKGATIEAARDFSKSKKPSESIRTADIPVGCRTLALPTADGYDCLSVTINKKGKASIKGTLDGGNTVSGSVQGALGAAGFAVPVCYTKSITVKATGLKQVVTFGFVLWINLKDGSASIANETGGRWVGGERAISQKKDIARPADRTYEICFATPSGYLETSDDGISLTPNGEKVYVSGRKWTSTKSVGTVKFDDVEGVIVKVSKNKLAANVSKFKLSYTEKTGKVKGSFKLHYLDMASGKVKKASVTVTGIAVGGQFYGNAVIKKKGIYAIWWK